MHSWTPKTNMLSSGVGTNGVTLPFPCLPHTKEQPNQTCSFMTCPSKLLTFRHPYVLVKVSEMSGFSAKTESKLCIMIFSLLKATQCLSDAPIIPPLQQSVINCGVTNFIVEVLPCGTTVRPQARWTFYMQVF